MLQEKLQREWQEVNYEGTIAKAPPCPERRMRTPEFFVDKERGKPVEFSREGGYCIVGESSEGKSRN